MKSSLKQLDILAALVVSIRTDWGKTRTFDMLRKARDGIDDDLQNLTAAALKAALTARNKTPDVLGMTGPHWRPDEPGRPRQTADHACPTCRTFHDRAKDGRDLGCPRLATSAESYAAECRRRAREAIHRTQDAKTP
jgi:hypothetical protein